MKLTPTEREVIFRWYDSPELPRAAVTGAIGGHLALLHLAGPEAVEQAEPRP